MDASGERGVVSGVYSGVESGAGTGVWSGVKSTGDSELKVKTGPELLLLVVSREYGNIIPI